MSRFFAATTLVLLVALVAIAGALSDRGPCAAADGEALKQADADAPLAPRRRLALQFRRAQKVLLNRALAESAKGRPKRM